VGDWRDAEGRPFAHTYFYPAEQYVPSLLDQRAEHCRAGWGEIEIQLHHGVGKPDTSQYIRQQLVEFRDALTARGCLSQEAVGRPSRYAFVHGNWALANCDGGKFCGVDYEMQILAETGCYADYTSAPSPAQVAKINSLYECALPLHLYAPHRKGANLQCGRTLRIFPLIMQGPLSLRFDREGPVAWAGAHRK
jgi:hypothetical protein